MSRDLATEIDALRSELTRVSKLVQEVQAAAQKREVQEAEELELLPRTEELDPGTVELARLAKTRGTAGLITYRGYYGSGGREYFWVTEERSAEELLGQDDDQVARVLAALGNKQRLALLKAILEGPASAAELVDRLDMGTTGQVYHHLKALQAADLVTQEERGQFAFIGHRAQGLLMLLAGVRDMLDARYSAGRWDGRPAIANGHDR